MKNKKLTINENQLSKILWSSFDGNNYSIKILKNLLNSLYIRQDSNRAVFLLIFCDLKVYFKNNKKSDLPGYFYHLLDMLKNLANEDEKNYLSENQLNCSHVFAWNKQLNGLGNELENLNRIKSPDIRIINRIYEVKKDIHNLLNKIKIYFQPLLDSISTTGGRKNKEGQDQRLSYLNACFFERIENMRELFNLCYVMVKNIGIELLKNTFYQLKLCWDKPLTKLVKLREPDIFNFDKYFDRVITSDKTDLVSLESEWLLVSTRELLINQIRSAKDETSFEDVILRAEKIVHAACKDISHDTLYYWIIDLYRAAEHEINSAPYFMKLWIPFLRFTEKKLDFIPCDYGYEHRNSLEAARYKFKNTRVQGNWQEAQNELNKDLRLLLGNIAKQIKELLGVPPSPFFCYALGSLSRGDALTHSDFEGMLIWQVTLTDPQQRLWFQTFTNLFGLMLANIQENSLSSPEAISGFHADIDATFCRGLPADEYFGFRYCGSIDEILDNIPKECDPRIFDPGRVFSLLNAIPFYESEGNSAHVSCVKSFENKCFDFLNQIIPVNGKQIPLHQHYALLLLNRDLNLLSGIRFEKNWPLYTSAPSFDLKILSSFFHYTLGRIGLYYRICSLTVSPKLNFKFLLDQLVTKGIISFNSQKIILNCMEYLLQLRQTAMDFYGGQTKPEIAFRYDAHRNDKEFQLNDSQTLKIEWIEHSVIRPLYEFAKVFREKLHVPRSFDLNEWIQFEDALNINKVSARCYSDSEIDIETKLIQKCEVTKSERNWSLYLNFQCSLISYFIFSNEKLKAVKRLQNILYEDPIHIEEKVLWAIKIKKIDEQVFSLKDLALIDDYYNLFVKKINSYETYSVLRKEILQALQENRLNVVVPPNKGWMTPFGSVLPLSLSEATDKLKQAIEEENRDSIMALIGVLNSHKCFETILEEWQRPTSYPRNPPLFLSTAMTATERETEMIQIFKRIFAPSDGLIEIITTIMGQISSYIQGKTDEENLNQEEKIVNEFYKQFHRYLFCLRPPYYYVITALGKKVTWREALILAVLEKLTPEHALFARLKDVIQQLKKFGQQLLELDQGIIEIGVRYLYNYYSEFIHVLSKQKPFERLKQLHPYVQVYIEDQGYFSLPLVEAYRLLGQNPKGAVIDRIPGAKNRVTSVYGLHWKNGAELYSGMEGLAYEWHKLFAPSDCVSLATPTRIVTFRGFWEETPQGLCKIPGVPQPSNNVTVVQASHNVKGITLAQMIFLTTKFNEWYSIGGQEILKTWLKVVNVLLEKSENDYELKDWSYRYQRWLAHNVTESLLILKQLARIITTNTSIIQQGGQALFDFISTHTFLLISPKLSAENFKDIFEFSMVCCISLPLLFGNIVESEFDYIIETVRGNFLGSWDTKQLSYLALSNFLTQPTDGKANNYQVSIIHEKKQKLILRIVGIDNDDILNEEVGINKGGETVLKHRSILYFFNPIMDAVITEEIISDLKKRIRDKKIILYILTDCLRREQKWLQAHYNGLITIGQYGQDTLKWPIQMSTAQCLGLETRIVALMKGLTPGRTIEQIMQTFNPKLFGLYSECFNQIFNRNLLKFQEFLFPNNSFPKISHQLFIKPTVIGLSRELKVIIQNLLALWLQGNDYTNQQMINEWLTEEQVITLTEYEVNLQRHIDLSSQDKWIQKAVELLMPKTLGNLLSAKHINIIDEDENSLFHSIFRNYINQPIQAYLVLKLLIKTFQSESQEAFISLNKGNKLGHTPLFIFIQNIQGQPFNNYHQFLIKQTLDIAIPSGFDINAENSKLRPLFIIHVEAGLNELERLGYLSSARRHLIIQLFQYGAFYCNLTREEMEKAFQFFYVQCAADRELKRLADQYAWQRNDFGWYVAEKLNLQSSGNFALISCKTQKRCYLTQLAQDTILDKNNQIKEIAGKRVCSHGGWFFKQNPELLINVEAIPALIKLILNSSESISLSEIFRAETSIKPYLLQVSAAAPSVYGNNLEDVLCVLENPNHPDYSQVQEYWRRMDVIHTWKLILMSMLILFEDANAKNFILVQVSDLKSLNQKTQLIMIDYQRALLPAVVQEREKEPVVLWAKSVLFCLDLLCEPIPPEARGAFNKPVLAWYQTFSTWLNELEQITKIYQSQDLTKNLNLSANEFSDLCVTPLQRGSMSSLMHRASRMYNAFKRDTDFKLTGLSLLKAVVPEIAYEFERLHSDPIFPTPLSRLKMIYCGNITCSSIQTHQLVIFMQKPIKPFFSFGYYFPIPEAREELEQARQEESQVEQALCKYVQNHDLKQLLKGLQKLYGDKTIEWLLKEFSRLGIWLRMTNSQQQTILQFASNAMLNRLYITDCSAIDDEFLIKILRNSPRLTNIKIHFSNNFFETLSTNKSRLTDNVLKTLQTRFMQNQIGSTQSQVVNKRLSFRGACFVYLWQNQKMPITVYFICKLVLDNCKGLKIVWLESPHLEQLSLQNCPKVESLYLKTSKLDYLNLLNTINVRLKDSLDGKSSDVSCLKILKIEDQHPCISAIKWRKVFPKLLFDNLGTSLEEGMKNLHPLTVMHWATPDNYEEVWFWAIKNGLKELLSCLISIDNTLIKKSDKLNGLTSLHHAVIARNLEIALWLVQSSRGLMLQKDNNGMTILHHAVKAQDLQIVQWLVNGNSRECMLLLQKLLLQKDHNGMTILHYAVNTHNLEIVQWLAEKYLSCRKLFWMYVELFQQQDNEGVTVLDYAIKIKNLPIVQCLIKSILKLVSIYGFSKSPLHVAVENEAFEIVQYLGKIFPTLLLKRDARGWTVLHYALIARNLEIAQWLVQQNQELILQKDIVIWFAQTHRQAIKKDNARISAVKAKDIEILKWLGRSYKNVLPDKVEGTVGAKILETKKWIYQALGLPKDQQKLYLLKFLNILNHIKTGNLTLLRSLIFLSPELLLQKYKNKKTVLHIAVQEGKLNIVRFFLTFSELLLQKDNAGWTALHYAIYWGKLTIAQTLMETSQKLLLQKDEVGQTALHFAVQQGRLTVAQLLVRESRELFCLQDHAGRTVLHFAASLGNLLIVKWLVQNSRELLLLKDHRGQTPLHYAVQKRNSTIAQCLVKESKELLLQSDNNGRTALHVAVEWEDLSIARWLVQKSRKLLLQSDNQGITPIHLAMTTRQLQISQYLLSELQLEYAKRRGLVTVTAHIIQEDKKSVRSLFQLCFFKIRNKENIMAKDDLEKLFDYKLK